MSEKSKAELFREATERVKELKEDTKPSPPSSSDTSQSGNEREISQRIYDSQKQR